VRVVELHADAVEAHLDELAQLLLDGDILVGAVHLARASAENGRHRAEIQRLVVSAANRGQGIGRMLMEAAIGEARRLELRLLWLMTHEGTAADRIYQRLGWTRLGVIPAYSTLPDGSVTGNAYYYLELD
jgi:GNAT superfamily N-acetyltransferase